MDHSCELTLYLFGWPRLERHGRPVAVETRKALALLAYLAVTGESHSRDKLAAIFWSGYGSSRARANLRRALWSVNRALGEDVLVTDQEQIHLPATDRLWIDVVQFQQLTQQPIPQNGHHDVDNDAPGKLSTAVSLFQDDFLAGFHLDDSPDFDDWQIRQADELQRQLMNTLELVVETHICLGEFTNATRLAQRWLALDELNEQAHRRLMSLYSWQGERTAALRQYQDCTAVLQTELDVSPTHETKSLYELIRQGDLPLPNVTRPSIPENRQEDQPLAIPTNPYRGLFAFRQEDSRAFFGREAFTHDLITAVHRHPLVALFGSSGSGKSSVIQAGLLAHLSEESGWQIAQFRPSSRPFRSLAAGLVPHLAPDLTETERLRESAQLAKALQTEEISLIDVLDQIQSSDNELLRFLLVADQFEELFTLCPDAELRRAFLDVLLTAVNAQPPHTDPSFTFLFGLRADFLGQALNYRPFADAIQHHDIKLSPMTAVELRRAIQQPAQLQGVQFEAGLIGRILADVGEEPGNLPLLQFALTALWPRQENGLITHEAYKAIGRVEGALSAYADDTLAELTPEEQLQARTIFVQLVRPGDGTEDTRRLATRTELGEANWQLVQKLADARLVVTGRDALGHEVVEVAHEALIRSWQQLREWMTVDRAFRTWQERLRVSVRQWEAMGYDTGPLLRGIPLAEASGWLEIRPSDISEREQAFIQASHTLQNQRAAQREKAEADKARLRTRIIFGLILALLLMGILSVTAVWQWRQAETREQAVLAAEAQTAAERAQAMSILSRQLALHGESLLTEEVDLAMLLSVEAANIADTVEARRSLLTALNFQPRLRHFGRAHEGDVSSVVFNRDGNVIISAGEDGVLHFWDTALQETAVLDLSGSATKITTMAGNPTSDLIAVGGENGTILMVDSAQRRVMPLSFPAHSGNIVHLSFSADGRRLASVAQDNRFLLWDAATGKLLDEPLSSQAGKIVRFAFSPNGRVLATGDNQGAIQLWDTRTFSPLSEPIAGHDGAVAAMSFDSDGRVLATGGLDRLVRLWDGQTGASLSEPLVGHEDRVRTVAFSGDGRLLASAGHDHTVRLWHVATASQTAEVLQAHKNNVLALAFSPIGTKFVSAGADETVVLWDLAIPPAAAELYGQSGKSMSSVALSRDGRFLAAGSTTGQVIIWDLATGSVVNELAAPQRVGIVQLVFSEDNQTLTAVNQMHQVTRWPLVDDAPELLFQEIPSQQWGPVEFALDNRYILSSAEDDMLHVWDVENEAVVTVIEAITSPAYGNASLSADGRYLAVPDCNNLLIPGFNQDCLPNNILLWDMVNGRWLPQQFIGDYNMITDTSFSPDGTLLGAVKDNGTLILWQVENGEVWLENTLTSQLDSFQTLQFSPDGRVIAVGLDTGELLLWDVASAQLIGRLPAFYNTFASSVSFAADEPRLATLGRDGQVIVWDIQPAIWQEYLCQRINRNLTPEEWQQYMGDVPYHETCP